MPLPEPQTRPPPAPTRPPLATPPPPAASLLPPPRSPPAAPPTPTIPQSQPNRLASVTLAAPTQLTLPELLQRIHLPSPAPAPLPARHGKSRPDLPIALFAQLPHSIQRWFQVERLDAHNPTTFTGLHRLRSALATTNDRTSRLAAAAIAFASESISTDALHQPDYGIPLSWGYVDYLPTDDVTGMHIVMAAVDELVTLLDGQHPSKWLSYSPLPTFVEAADWRAGMIHEPPHRAEWEKLTTCSKWLKMMLRHHFYTKARTAVPPRSATNSRPLRPSDPLYDPVKAEFVRNKLAYSVSRGILKRRRTPCHVTNSLSLVDKPPGSKDPWRIVDNMSHLKENYDKERFKSETIADLPNILRPDMFMFKVDLMAGYFNMLVRRCMRRLFGTTFEGMHLEANAAPFAFRSSARWMHKVTRTVCAHYRRLGMATTTYLDDKLYAAPGFVATVRQRNIVIPHGERLGFRYNSKSSALPRRSIEFLGVVVHLASPTPSLHIPIAKLERYLTFASDLLTSTGSWQLRKLAKLAGMLTSCALAVPAARLWSRGLYASMYPPTDDCRTEAVVRRDWDAFLQASPEAVAEITEMIATFSQHNDIGYPIWYAAAISPVGPLAPQFTLTVDASSTAAGYVLRPPWLLEWFLIAVEYCCATGTAVLEFLLTHIANPFAVGVLLDVLPAAVVLAHFPAHLHCRLLFIQCVPEHFLDETDIGTAITAKWPSASLANVARFHASPPCNTYTLAGHYRDSRGLPGNRHRPNGPNGPGLSPEAVAADALTASLIGIGIRLSNANPFPCSVTVENPNGLFAETTAVRAALALPPNAAGNPWQLATFPYCRHTTLPVPCKPTTFLFIGLSVADETCDRTCRHSVDGRHVLLLCNTSNMPPHARRVPAGFLRAQIPAEVHRHLNSQPRVRLPSPHDPYPLHARDRPPPLTAVTVNFTDDEGAMHQAALELYALATVVRDLASRPDSRGCRLLVRTDAMSTVWYFRNHGGRSPLLNKIFRYLYAQLSAAGMRVVDCVHISGLQMIAEGVDALSRPRPHRLNSTADRSRWRVTAPWFQRFQHWVAEPLAVDLFASRTDHRLPRFYTLEPCAEAEGVPNCFANTWPVGITHYAHPPLGDIPNLLRHITATNSRVLALVPDWPSQPWWPALHALTVRSWQLGRPAGLFERLAHDTDTGRQYVPVTRPLPCFRLCLLQPTSAAPSQPQPPTH